MKLINRYNVLLIFIINFGFLSDVLAQSQKPKKCPSLSSLQTVQIQESDLIEKEPGRMACCTPNGFPYWVDGKWSIHDYVNNYDTENKWALSFGDVQANNSEQALQKYSKNLSTLSFESGPHRGSMGGWYCSYRSSEGGAVTFLKE